MSGTLSIKSLKPSSVYDIYFTIDYLFNVKYITKFSNANEIVEALICRLEKASWFEYVAPRTDKI